MRDPGEHLTTDGFIATGAARDRVPAVFRPVLEDVAASLGPDASVQVYGSVATGQARVGTSDVDVVVMGLEPGRARALGRELSARYQPIAREVAVSAWSAEALGPGDEGYGNRIFLKHYCTWWSGPDVAASLPRYPGDVAAARGFNGDLAVVVERWRDAAGRLDPKAPGDVAALARRVGRKTLFAVAGMVSVQDHVWTTDRSTAATRWAELNPGIADDLASLLAWGDGAATAGHADLTRMLDTTVAGVTDDFASLVGMWRPAH